MRGSLLSIVARLLGIGVIGGGLLLWNGCDTVPALDRAPQPPSVSGLQVVPDSLHESDLPADRVGDGGAQVPFDVSARAADPDGSIVRVVFVLEPSSNPQGVLSGRLPAQPQADSLYGGRLALTVPLVDEVYTVRVFAVDDDSLASNQVTGQFRFVPSDSTSASGASSSIDGAAADGPPARRSFTLRTNCPSGRCGDFSCVCASLGGWWEQRGGRRLRRNNCRSCSRCVEW
jgi:hypothetical protein